MVPSAPSASPGPQRPPAKDNSAPMQHAPSPGRPQQTGRIAILVGATGLIGTELCRQLENDERFARIIVLTRRPLTLSHPRLQVAEIDFSLLDAWTPDFPIDTVFCALGTTIAKAGSQQAFRAVDQDLILSVGRLAQRARCQHFVFVSSAGATPHTHNFYLRVKGETEEALRDLALPHTVALRPSVLDGNRQEERKGEQFALKALKALRPLLIGPLEKFRATPATLVATAMRDLAQPGREGFEVVDAVTIGRWHDRVRLTDPAPGPRQE